MKREFSAGGIVLRQAQYKYSKDKWEVLLTKHSANHHWGFPKGLIEEGHTSEETALREVKEEGGVEAKIIEKVGYSKYIYTFEKSKIFKVVTYFLMEYISGDPKDHDWEMEEAGWFPPDEALKTLSFSQDKSLLKNALLLIGSHNQPEEQGNGPVH